MVKKLFCVLICVLAASFQMGAAEGTLPPAPEEYAQFVLHMTPLYLQCEAEDVTDCAVIRYIDAYPEVAETVSPALYEGGYVCEPQALWKKGINRFPPVFIFYGNKIGAFCTYVETESAANVSNEEGLALMQQWIDELYPFLNYENVDECAVILHFSESDGERTIDQERLYKCGTDHPLSGYLVEIRYFFSDGMIGRMEYYPLQ